MTETRIVGGSLWMIGMRWAMRLIGLVSTIILARLLTPEDFGLVAMAAITVGLLDILTDTGVDLALLRDREATREHYDTAWTIQVIQGVLVTLLLFLLIEPAAIYFDEPRVRAALAVLALRPTIDGFRNIGIVAFRKELDFAREFRFQVLYKFASFIVVVTLAVVWRSYWALIIGRLVGGALGVAISYWMHEFRPRFTLAKARDIWSFSQWLLVSRIGIFGNKQADKFVVGGTTGTAAMGGYHVAKEVSYMLSSELVFPIRRALFPNFAIIAGDATRLRDAILMLISVVATLLVPLQFGLAVVAPDFVKVIFGPRWIEVTGLISILAIAGLATGMMMALEFLLPVTNRTGLAAAAAWLELVVLIPVLVWASQNEDLAQLASARMAVALAFVPIMMGLIARTCSVSFGSMASMLWRPLLAGIVMYAAVQGAYPLLPEIPLLRLLAAVLIGAVTYFAVLATVWIVAGKPRGVEKLLWQRL